MSLLLHRGLPRFYSVSVFFQWVLVVLPLGRVKFVHLFTHSFSHCVFIECPLCIVTTVNTGDTMVNKQEITSGALDPGNLDGWARQDPLNHRENPAGQRMTTWDKHAFSSARNKQAKFEARVQSSNTYTVPRIQGPIQFLSHCLSNCPLSSDLPCRAGGLWVPW